MKRVMCIALLGALVTGKAFCTSSSQSNQQSPAYTAADWNRDLAASFVASEVKKNADGTTEYTACFVPNEMPGLKCELSSRVAGRHDSFRKLDQFTPFWSNLNETLSTKSNVQIYVSALECKRPAILIAPVVDRKGGWAFMKKVAILADGKVVLEREFQHHEVQRSNDANGVFERIDLITNDADQLGLRQFIKAKERVVRITGSKGYLTLPAKDVEHLVGDVTTAFIVHDAIVEALSKAGGPECR